MSTFAKDEMGLRNVRGVLKDLSSRLKKLKEDRDDLDKQYIKVQRDKKDMYDKFEIAVGQLRNRADYKNEMLEEKLSVF